MCSQINAVSIISTHMGMHARCLLCASDSYLESLYKLDVSEDGVELRSSSSHVKVVDAVQNTGTRCGLSCQCLIRLSSRASDWVLVWPVSHARDRIKALNRLFLHASIQHM